MGDNGSLFPTPDLSANLQEGSSSSSQSSLLGLSLKKTPSFLNLVQNSLAKGKQAAVAGAGADVVVENNRCVKFPKKPDEKMKASSTYALFIAIGKWQKVTRYEGDLTVKVYYAKKKLVWEVLDGALKNKIEIMWNDISAIKAYTPQNEPGILHIELQNPPMFFRENNPQPRKHTIWNMHHDFTGGQAHIWRRHCVKFPSGVLDKILEKLLYNDPRLKALIHSPFPSHDSPYFDPNMYGVQQISVMLHNFEPGSSSNNPPLMPDVVGSSSSRQLQLQNCQNHQTSNVDVIAGVGVMHQQFQFDQNHEAQPTFVDEEVDQTMLGMNPTTYYNGGNPNFQNEFADYNANNIISNIPVDQQAQQNFFPQPQQEAHHDFFPQQIDYQFFPSPPQPQPQQESQHDFFPQNMDYQLFPPQQGVQHEFFQQHVNYQQLFPTQPQPQHDYFFPQHLNYQQLPDQPQQEPQYDLFPQHVNYQQYLGDDDVSLFMEQQRRNNVNNSNSNSNNNSFFAINPGSEPFY